MIATPYTENINDYLKSDNIIDFDNEAISNLAENIYLQSSDKTDFIRLAYEYVRDNIPHSADINADTVPCSAYFLPGSFQIVQDHCHICKRFCFGLSL